jgi:hypothetical protein
VQTGAASASRVPGNACTPRQEEGAEAARKTAWYTSVSDDIKSGFLKLSKNIEASLVSTSDSIGQAGSAVGTSAKAGYESTSEGAAHVAQAAKEGSAAAGDAIAEAGAKVKEAVGVDVAARQRLAELEDEVRRLKELKDENTRLKAQLAAAAGGGGDVTLRESARGEAAAGGVGVGVEAGGDDTRGRDVGAAGGVSRSEGGGARCVGAFSVRNYAVEENDGWKVREVLLY